MGKHIQKISITKDAAIYISNINIKTNEIEYYTMNGEIITTPKKIVRMGFTRDDMVEFDGIQINKQYLIQLLGERDYTVDEMETMFKLNSIE